MKQLTEAELRALLIRMYDEGFSSGVDAVRMNDFESGLEVEPLDVVVRDDLIDYTLADV